MSNMIIDSGNQLPIDWTAHYNMILKRMFQQLFAQLLQFNREIYSNATEKIVKPCEICGHNNKYRTCESCKFAEFLTGIKKEDIDVYIQRNLEELTEVVRIKTMKQAHRKENSSKLSELRGKAAKKQLATSDEQGNATKSRKRKNLEANDELDEQDIDLEAKILETSRKRTKRSS